VPETGRQKVIASVMSELRGYLAAVDAYETAVARQFGLDRAALRWFGVLADADGMSRAELQAEAGLSADALDDVLRRLELAGHVQSLPDDRVAMAPSAREALTAAMAPIDAAQWGLHRYAADELGIVRNFLRVGRHFYERQLRRLQR
jgi:hypothetical protein